MLGPGLAVFGVAVAVRWLHLWQISRLPFFDLLLGDAESYDAWAREIAAGDWIGNTVFYQAPLYPYFLAVVKLLLGDDLFVTRLLQGLVGASACLLLAHAVHRLFDRITGMIAGLMLALYGPAIFLDGLIQKSVLDLFFVALIIWIVSGLVVRPSRAGWRGVLGWVGLGLAVGGLVLTRENALVFLPAIALWLGLDRSRPGRARVAAGAGFVLGLGIALAPVATRNAVVGGGFHLTTSQLGPNLYIGNNAAADGTYRPLRPRRSEPRFERRDATELAEAALGRSLSPGAVSRYWCGRALGFAREHPGRWLALLARKLALAWNATEIADTEDQYTWAEWSWPLRVTGAMLHFGVVAPLALGGIVVTWSGRRRLYPLHLMLLFYVLGLVAFYVFARYRLPLAPFLILFAAAGAVAVWRRARSGRIPWAYLSTAVVAAVACNWPIFDRTALRAMTYCNFGLALHDADRPDDALACLELAVSLGPGLDVAHQRIGVIRAQRGDIAGATAAFDRALEIDPTYAGALTGLGNIAFLQGDLARAQTLYEEALRETPDDVDALNNLGGVLERRGDLDGALAQYDRVLSLVPDHPEARQNRLRVLDQQRRR